METLRIILVIFLLIGCCNSARRSRKAGKGRKPSGNQDQEQTQDQTGSIGDAAVEEGMPTSEQPPPVDEVDPPVVKPKNRKPQYFVTGPVPDAPPIATREREVQKLHIMTRGTGGVPLSGVQSATTKSTSRSRLTDSEKAILLNAHNEFRALTTNPLAANMVQLKWSTELAGMAQGWADQCSFAHGNPDNISPFYWVGQNIWAGTGSGWPVYEMVESWYEEVDLYNFATDGCSGVCGHYTQLVWADTTHVGCALQSCSPLQGLGWNSASILVCNYGEGGNYVGQKPYIPGTPCSQCPAGYSRCLQGRLCAEPGMTSGNPPPQVTSAPPPPAGPETGGGGTGGGNDLGTGSGKPGSPGSEPIACGGALTGKNGEFNSPNWPSPYTANQDCEWTIDVEADQTITVTVTVSYMDIEHNSQCAYDYLLITVRNAQGDGWRGTKYCGNRPLDPITADGNRVRIIFHSDGDVHRGGFKATYSISGGEPTPEPCGGLITQKSGTIKSPNYPGNYGENLDCTWTFKAPSGKRIRLKINQIAIEDDDRCQYDKLIIQLGNERIPMTLCGNEKPPGNYISLTNHAMVRFTSDDNTGHKGFAIGYKHI